MEIRRSMDLKNKRKHCVKIDRDITSEQVLALVYAVETEFIMEEEIGEEKFENDSNDGGDLLFPDAKVYIVSAENGGDETKKAKKSKGKRNSIIYLEEKSNTSSRLEVFCKKGVLRNFAKFTGKHPYYNENDQYHDASIDANSSLQSSY